MKMDLNEDKFGFWWGPARVTRIADDPKHGVWLTVCGAKESVEIRVTRKGFVRVSPVKKTLPHELEPCL